MVSVVCGFCCSALCLRNVPILLHAVRLPLYEHIQFYDQATGASEAHVNGNIFSSQVCQMNWGPLDLGWWLCSMCLTFSSWDQ